MRYTLARVLVVGVVAGVLLVAGAPLIIAVLVALIVALPLSMVLFRGLRGELDAALAQRSTQRAELRARLRGDGETGAAAGRVDEGEQGPEQAADHEAGAASPSSAERPASAGEGEPDARRG